MKKLFLYIILISIAYGDVNTNPPRKVDACIISANEQYINACINGVRYALEAKLDDTLYNEYSLNPIFVGTEYSKCTCSIERIKKRITKTRVREQVSYDYDPYTWKIILLKEPTPTKEALKDLEKLEPKKPKLKTGIICVKC